jgi:SAM-dependent methyltransferase
MSDRALRDHYERKYASEREATDVELVPVVTAPSTRFEAVVSFFPRCFSSGDVLELGAGNGNVAKSLLAHDRRIVTYTLGDISSARLGGLRRNLPDPRVRVLELDADALPERGPSYDAVLMVALIEHLVDPMATMRRVRALLKPGGFVYLDTPNIAKYTRRMKLLAGRFPATASRDEGLTTYTGAPADLYDEGHLHYFTYRSLSRMLLERCGFARTLRLGYHCGRVRFGNRILGRLANAWPELFSEIALVAYV